MKLTRRKFVGGIASSAGLFVTGLKQATRRNDRQRLVDQTLYSFSRMTLGGAISVVMDVLTTALPIWIALLHKAQD